MAPAVASPSIRLNKIRRRLCRVVIVALTMQLGACSPSRQIARESKKLILSDSNFNSAHVGISIYDPSTKKHLYSYQAEKYFIPASNTKLYTCYAAMKHLGDSLPGIRYRSENDSTLTLIATGDPTLLHPDFKTHPVITFLKEMPSTLQLALKWKETPLGNGWAWNDYDADYMPERSALPIAGNLLTIEGTATQYKYYPSVPGITVISDKTAFGATRAVDSNVFTIPLTDRYRQYKIPFKTNNGQLNIEILGAACGKPVDTISITSVTGTSVIHSQPLDSLLKPMMHRSDNFFAEQTLLMLSGEMTGVMSDSKIIDSLLKTDLIDLPQKPRWVDGSGLSRYNLFSPDDMVSVLTKMKNEFDWNRITTILPTGGEGTLASYYINLKDRIFAKTGTLSNNIALSGFLVTRQSKTLVFSVLVNNHMGNTTRIRKAVEKFLSKVAAQN